MSNMLSQAVNASVQNGEAPSPEPSDPQTLRQALDSRIKHTREQLERYCVAKAKADAAGILDYPNEFIQSLVW